MFLYVMMICFSGHVKYFISFFFFGLRKLGSSRMFKFAMTKNMSNFLIYLDFLVVVVIYIYYSKKKNKINPSTLAFTLKPSIFYYKPKLVNMIYSRSVFSLMKCVAKSHMLEKPFKKLVLKIIFFE